MPVAFLAAVATARGVAVGGTTTGATYTVACVGVGSIVAVMVGEVVAGGVTVGLIVSVGVKVGVGVKATSVGVNVAVTTIVSA